MGDSGVAVWLFRLTSPPEARQQRTVYQRAGGILHLHQLLAVYLLITANSIGGECMHRKSLAHTTASGACLFHSICLL